MRLKSIRTGPALILATLMMMVPATPVATAQTYTDLYNFDWVHGSDPVGILAQGRDGNLYGTAMNGGPDYYGVVFKITPSAKLKVLDHFDCCTGNVHGYDPLGGLMLGTDGMFYGTTIYGGSNSDCPDGCGTIFKTTKSGSLTTLYSFTGRKNGAGPYASPTQGADGSFYGTTASTAYKITSSGAFTSLGSLGGRSHAALVQGTDGKFYGTTLNAGTLGTVFKMTPKGHVTTVYTFDNTHGSEPLSPVIQSSDGNFYGTTYKGGSKGEGVIFKLTPQGAISVWHNFGDPNYPNDGWGPAAGLAQATDGNFYGVTLYGGTAKDGVIFQITPGGSYSILYNFDGPDGANPESTLMQHTNGKIYGLARSGGSGNSGVVYSFDLGLGPFVSFVGPLSSGKVGKTVEVLGQGFTGTTAVSFNGTAANYTVKSDTYLTAIVPSNATTGFVTVTTPSGTLKSNQQFRVKP